jgi:hypothetical protein
MISTSWPPELLQDSEHQLLLAHDVLAFSTSSRRVHDDAQQLGFHGLEGQVHLGAGRRLG